MRKFIMALSAVSLVAASAPSLAVAPRRAKGKFEVHEGDTAEADPVPRPKRQVRKVRDDRRKAPLSM